MASRVFSSSASRRPLLHCHSHPSAPIPHNRLLSSHLSAKAGSIDVVSDQDPAAASPPAPKPEKLSATFRVFEDLIHGMIVQRCEPTWLPLVPGASFWVPPRPESGSFAKEIEDLTDGTHRLLSDEETMALASMRGWPCSSHLLQGREVGVEKLGIWDLQEAGNSAVEIQDSDVSDINIFSGVDKED